MWMLLLLVMTANPSEVKIHEIESYETSHAEADCMADLKVTVDAMKKEYPGKFTYALMCVKQPDKEV